MSNDEYNESEMLAHGVYSSAKTLLDYVQHERSDLRHLYTTITDTEELLLRIKTIIRSNRSKAAAE